eukprot:TRINITY_DN8264_c0_g1_i1.p1 TRINITY_DN8264_c0_g1~~TRINITY_DN8264_c0_g1_i1.p1  ORF type:complete len:214 (-),score=59.28 TRINITY_DN8264_c0_g1_i1:42-632(-)
MMLSIFFSILCLGVLAVPQRRIQNGPFRSSHNATAAPKAGCDPDYGWIPGVDGTKCYMVVKDFSFSNCYIGSGDYYYGMTWFESMACCYANHGYMAEPVSQEEHDLIKSRLLMVNGEGEKSAWWLGGSDWFNEGEWRWSSGQAFSFTNWKEGEPNDVGNEDCVSMSSQEDYQWEDLGCNTGSHSDIPHYVVCERLA